MTRSSLSHLIVKLVVACSMLLIGAGCSLAVDTRQEIEIPIRKDASGPRQGQATERLKDIVDEYQLSF